MNASPEHNRSRRILAAGGGTGGHLFPALAIVEELEAAGGWEVLFAGTRRGLESRVIPEKGYTLKTLWISGFHRGRVFRNMLFPLKVLVSFLQALEILMRFRPDVVLGTGGYTAGPLLAAAILFNRKTVIQEQNCKPGLVTRILAPHVDAVHLSFDASRECFKKQANLHVSGNPVRREFLNPDRRQGFNRFGLDTAKRTLFVFGGSQGSRIINETFLEIAGRLLERQDIQVLWSTGPLWLESIRSVIRDRDRIRTVPFVTDMGMAYGISDLILCRSGATTVAEITAIGIPSILIPFAGAAGGHQEMNARLLERSGAALVITENELSGESLLGAVLTLLDDPEKREAMAGAAGQLGKREAAAAIAGQIVRMTDGA